MKENNYKNRVNSRLWLMLASIALVVIAFVAVVLPQLDTNLNVKGNEQVNRVVEAYQDLGALIEANPTSEELQQTHILEKNILAVKQNGSENLCSLQNYLSVATEESDGELYIIISAFVEKTGDGFNAESQIVTHGLFTCNLNGEIEFFNENEYAPLRKLAIDLGYVYNTSIVDDDVEIGREFKDKRIIVNSKVQPTSNFGAKEELNLNGTYIYQYATEYEAKNAIEGFTAQGVNVCVDVPLSVPTEPSLLGEEKISIPSSFKSWGGDMMGFKEYANYLATKGRLKEVVAVVIDTGVDPNHPLIKDRLINKRLTGDIVKLGLVDETGHGTHVAGTIADLTPSNVKILSLNYFSKHSSSLLYMLEYIRSLKESGLNIVSSNGSFSSHYSMYENQTATTEIQEVLRIGIVCCFAAGNYASNVSYAYPANIPNVISVSAMTVGKGKADFSNYGKGIDFTAPGVSVLSAKAYSKDYCHMNGTSMACPHLTAAASLIASEPKTNYSFKEVELLLKKSAVDIGEEGFDYYFGWGYPDLRNLINKDVNVEKALDVNVNFVVENESPYNSNFCGVRLSYSLNNEQIGNDFTREDMNTSFNYSTTGNTIISSNQTNTWKMVGVYLSNDETRGKKISDGETVEIGVSEFDNAKKNTLTIVVRNEQMIKVVVNVNVVDDPEISSNPVNVYNSIITGVAKDEEGLQKSLNHQVTPLHDDQIFEFFSNKSYDVPFKIFIPSNEYILITDLGLNLYRGGATLTSSGIYYNFTIVTEKFAYEEVSYVNIIIKR